MECRNLRYGILRVVIVCTLGINTFLVQSQNTTAEIRINTDSVEIKSIKIAVAPDYSSKSGITLYQLAHYPLDSLNQYFHYKDELSRKQDFRIARKIIKELPKLEIDSFTVQLHPPPDITIVAELIDVDGSKHLLFVPKTCRTVIGYNGYWLKTDESFWNLFERLVPKDVQSILAKLKQGNKPPFRGGWIYYL